MVRVRLPASEQQGRSALAASTADTVLAFAARRPAGLLGVVNVSGGAWRTNGEGNVCEHADLVAAMATFGSRTRIPTLWLYAENDQSYGPDLARQTWAVPQSAGKYATSPAMSSATSHPLARSDADECRFRPEESGA